MRLPLHVVHVDAQTARAVDELVDEAALEDVLRQLAGHRVEWQVRQLERGGRGDVAQLGERVLQHARRRERGT